MKTRLVVDPNVLASALLGGLTSDRFDWLLKDLPDRFDLCYSETVIEEVTALSEIPFFQKKGITPMTIKLFLDDFRSYSIKVITTSKVKLGHDSNDYYLLGLARDARAQYLITGDPDLPAIGSYGKTEILTLKTLLEIVER